MRPLSLIGVTAKHIAQDHIKRVGILASPMTVRSRLYENQLAAQGIQSILPTEDELEQIESIIRLVISSAKPNRQVLDTLAANLIDRGAERILLGCSELSLAGRDSTINFIDALDIAVETIFKPREK